MTLSKILNAKFIGCVCSEFLTVVTVKSFLSVTWCRAGWQITRNFLEQLAARCFMTSECYEIGKKS